MERQTEQTQRFLFPLEEMEGLLKAIHDTLEIKEAEDKELSVDDQVYAGLQTKQSKTFPNHATLKEKRFFKNFFQ